MKDSRTDLFLLLSTLLPLIKKEQKRIRSIKKEKERKREKEEYRRASFIQKQ